MITLQLAVAVLRLRLPEAGETGARRIGGRNAAVGYDGA